MAASKSSASLYTEVALPGISYHQVARLVGDVGTSFRVVVCHGYAFSPEFRLLGDFSPTCLLTSLTARAIFKNGETMNQAVTLFVSTFTTLLAIINPLESLPVFLRLLEGKDQRAHRLVARRACTYATLLLLFFLIF